MIPLELHLRNFLSHRETDIDFRGVHLATLIGENGAGKSSLLDAITWAVWGRSRASYGSDETLITHGEDALEVEYVFRMPYLSPTSMKDGAAPTHAKRERCFRILRRREQRGRRSVSSVLDFQVKAAPGNEGGNAVNDESTLNVAQPFPFAWVSLTADSIRDTQARIIEQLGLEYDTFINSAYLRQGHADEFTTQSPADRKRVLGAILGLDRWNTYQDHAKQRLSEAKGRLDEVERRIQETKLELDRRPEYEAQLARAEAQVEEASQHLQAVQEQADALMRLQEQAAGLRRQLADLDQNLDREQERLQTLRQEEGDHRQQLEAYQDQIARGAEIEAQHQTYQDAVEEERAWVEKLSQAARLQEEKAGLEQRIAQTREALAEQIHDLTRQEVQVEREIERHQGGLAQRISDWRGQIRMLEERVLGPQLTAQLRQAEADLDAYERMGEELEQAREALRTSELEAQRLIQHNEQLRASMDEKKAALDKLAAANAAAEAVCPLCRQPLTPAHRKELLARIQAEGTLMGDEFRANRSRRQTLENKAVDLRSQIEAYDLKLQARPRQEHVVARLRQQVEQSEEAMARREELQSQIQRWEAKIAAEDYALAERKKLNEIHKKSTALQADLDQQAYAKDSREALRHTLAQLGELGYDAEAHEAAKARVRTLSTAEAAQRELETARMEVHGVESALARLMDEIEAQAARIAQLEETHTNLKEELATLKPHLEEMPRVAQRLHQARMQESQARQQVGAARQNLAALKTLGKRLENYQEQRDTLAGRVVIFTELREAFGVNGIPAMIIEHTLPELEREANRILQQLTDGRMHVRFDTQRETKRGTVRETLDIVISDEKGTRPYDNFSGGEKFRVNFAIRVALSRLLAQRAGVQLRSLFVDEGFGTLDAEGRQRLVEAVKAVQRDFDLILVITHIDELRDAFPSRIQVTKTESGSQVEVI